MNKLNLELIKKTILDVPDYPKKGIIFKDITPLLENPQAFKSTIAAFKQLVEEEAKKSGKAIKKVLAIESRGFLFGAPLALEMNCGLVIARKPKKLPRELISVDIQLEYGTDALAIHRDAIAPGENILIIDDVLATGGTAAGACQLIKKAGGNSVQAVFLIELDFLKGRAQLKTFDPLQIISLLQY
ncbi:MAG: adenine phosphoribosyltransferase [Pseudomonadota bacterium]